MWHLHALIKEAALRQCALYKQGSEASMALQARRKVPFSTRNIACTRYWQVFILALGPEILLMSPDLAQTGRYPGLCASAYRAIYTSFTDRLAASQSYIRT